MAACWSSTTRRRFANLWKPCSNSRAIRSTAATGTEGTVRAGSRAAYDLVLLDLDDARHAAAWTCSHEIRERDPRNSQSS